MKGTQSLQLPVGAWDGLVERLADIMPEDVGYIINTLERAGYEAYAVGGCVRDALLGRVPNDWDITTSAKPQEVKALFSHTIDTGIEHGTVTVMLHRVGYEVTTYRVDGTYLDGRHPSGVSFTASLSEDLLRRDFTINAMAYHPMRGVVDLYGGRQDLEQGVMRCVGNPMERFSEDALRILRGVRFAAQLGYTIADDTAEAMISLRENLRLISQERIQVELVKLLTSDHPETFYLLYEYGITKIIMPEFDACMRTPQNSRYHSFGVGDHILRVLAGVEGTKRLRLAALFHDFGKAETLTVEPETGITHFYGHAEVSAKIAKEIMHRLKFDNDTIEHVERLVRFHDARLNEPTPRQVRRLVYRIGAEDYPDLLKLMRADSLGKHLEADGVTEKTLQNLQKMQELYQEICEENQCISLKQLAVKGGDIITLGVKPGPAVGEMLHRLLEMVLEEPKKNEKEVLLQQTKVWLEVAE